MWETYQMKVIEQVINYARDLKNKGFKLDYQTETRTGLVQVYIDLSKKGIVVVSGPLEVIKQIMEVLENN